LAGAVLEGPVAWRVRPVGETFLEDAQDRGRTESALVGATGRVQEGLSVDAAVRAAWSGGESIHEVRAGLTWDFPFHATPDEAARYRYFAARSLRSRRGSAQ